MNEVHHTTERFLFEDIQGKKVEVDFDGGEVSSDAGLLFLREVERRRSGSSWTSTIPKTSLKAISRWPCSTISTTSTVICPFTSTRGKAGSL